MEYVLDYNRIQEEDYKKHGLRKSEIGDSKKYVESLQSLLNHSEKITECDLKFELEKDSYLELRKQKTGFSIFKLYKTGGVSYRWTKEQNNDSPKYTVDNITISSRLFEYLLENSLEPVPNPDNYLKFYNLVYDSLEDEQIKKERKALLTFDELLLLINPDQAETQYLIKLHTEEERLNIGSLYSPTWLLVHGIEKLAKICNRPVKDYYDENSLINARLFQRDRKLAGRHILTGYPNLEEALITFLKSDKQDCSNLEEIVSSTRRKRLIAPRITEAQRKIYEAQMYLPNEDIPELTSHGSRIRSEQN